MRPPRRDGGIHASDDFENEVLHVVGFECVFEGRQFVEHAAQGPHVALVVVGTIFANFGRKIIGGACRRI